ncbi:MAG TPA: hypothetical protein VNG69_01780 [Casimicrobiaceae bacterium]|nr:hypothetical protein [Casimicrobiaceae bacterium]
MKAHHVLAIFVVAASLSACGERSNSPIKTGTAVPTPATQATAPPAPTDRSTPPAPTPATHAQAPQPTEGAANAPTARDTPAAAPASALTPAEESKSMPKPGQTDNHFTTSTDGQVKGSQQSSGTPPPAEGTGAPPSTVAPSK